MFIVSVIVWSNCHILQFLHPNVQFPPCCGRRTLRMRCYI